MSVSKSDGLSALVSRVFGDQNDTALEEGAAASKPLRSTHDHSNQQMNGHTRDLESGIPSPARSERPPIPSALPSSGEAASTPLPILPMIVLSIVSFSPSLIPSSR